MKLLAFLIAILLLLGVGGLLLYQWMHATPTSHSLPNTTLSGDDEIFRLLTKSTWCNRSAVAGHQSLLAPTSITHTYAADGTFRSVAVSDVVEEDQSGRWSFRRTGSREGVLFRDDGDAYAFQLVSDTELTLGSLTLEACDPLTVPAVTITSVAPSALYQTLIQKKWVMTESASRGWYPTDYQLFDNGTYRAVFRSGECELTGRWSLVAERSRIEPSISLRVPASSCDTRGLREAYLTSYTISQENGVTTFGSDPVYRQQ